MPPLHINTITLTAFKDVLSRYSATVPEKLRDLDTQRYDAIPTAVAARETSNKHLTNDEVEKLVEWKLKHGTFRPALLGLVQSNTSRAIEDTTRKSYKALLDGKTAHANALPALKILVGLRGIGPATASLLLSVLEPTEVPFFSDELFRWCTWDDEGKTGKGWQRKIKYNVKEYETVVQNVEKLRERLGRGLGEGDERVKAVDVERVAWVLGKEGCDVGVVDGVEEGVKTHGVEVSEQAEGEKRGEKAAVDEDVGVKKEEEKKPAVKKGTKRKAADSKIPAEGTRKSSRTKKT
ncbi:hypothetical protein CFE70_007218 [Pyrenophora teres f. teres 0-1]|uniref:Uncharacterized protein n=2 Tax=Pyrenophora teres f. teres TaxID=97479 RepID=E3S9H3_PYRTT|nr:hypothetical protein PTT_19694 [Pyrenophora teres f. teres 0-1]KAE8825790.1 hypothetical protein HRS9139_08900 [Pyrenophora teres f. teres]KAE8834888.1 hypothetical protein PTNB85_06221 [Pyrenophora teres f. teres]KAE8843635.1 hypothetical protein HRS9122_04738 [Pyrenophora teres f. teres]KAE8861176.1 hypothetical protein PTNB29_06271 [Pyrenophora teres f. teres]